MIMNEVAESTLWAVVFIASFRVLQMLLFRHMPMVVQWRGQQVTAIFEFMFITSAFVSLILAYVISDFSLKNVVENSHSQLSLFYRIAAVWSNHEGSLLLWLWILSLYGLVMVLKTSPTYMQLQRSASAWHGLLVLLIGSYMLLTSNPFAHTDDFVSQGQELNPLLHDPALAIHPPILYLGYVGFAVPFCYALALAFCKSTLPQYTYGWTMMRRWLLWSWSFLTLGIALGSLWAYYELGWGGWWFWDPVENASLLPWLTATAALHTLHMARRSQDLMRMTWCLVVSSFILCLLGTFLVRSGVLSTVHAFAYDAMRGRWLLALMMIITSITIVAAVKIQRQWPFVNRIILGWNRPTLLCIMAYLLIVMMLTVLVGTLYPLWLRAIGGQEISIGVPYFEKTFIPMGLVIVIIMALAPYVPWLTQGCTVVFRQIHWGLSLILLSCTGLLFLNITKILAGCALIIGIWTIIMTVAGVINVPKSRRWSYLRSGMVWAHLGCGCMIVGMASDHLGQKMQTVALKVGESVNFNGYTVQLQSLDYYHQSTYITERAVCNITHNGQSLSNQVRPEKRFYPSYEALISKTALLRDGLSILYLSLGGVLPQDRWTIRLYYHSYILLIWIGAFIMAVGGLLSWRQYRNDEENY